MTDAIGMIGGHLRRLGKPEDALERFALGRMLESNRAFGIVSSYNSVNWLVTKIELQPEDQVQVAQDIDLTIDFLTALTQGARNQDGWAWADLGTCLTLWKSRERRREGQGGIFAVHKAQQQGGYRLALTGP